MTEIDVVIYDAVCGPRATVVQAYAEVDGEVIEVSGEALRHPHDKDDPELATMLAYGRALEKLGKRLSRRANGLVKHNDDIAAIRQKQKQNKKDRLMKRMQQTRA